MTLMAERQRFQFRMRDLLWAVSLIGVSLGLGLTFLRVAENASPFDAGAPFVMLGLFFGASAAFGAGIGSLFRRPALGAVGSVLIATISACMIIRLVALSLRG